MEFCKLCRSPQRTRTVGAAVGCGILAAAVYIEMAVAGAGPSDAAGTFPREAPVVKRPFKAVIGDEWIGNGISYGPHRDGQRPGGRSPSKAELREDLLLIRRHWRLLRMYSARDASEAVLQVIRDERLGLKVMLGTWVGTEVKLADDRTVAERLSWMVSWSSTTEGAVASTDSSTEDSAGSETSVPFPGRLSDAVGVQTPSMFGATM